MRQEVRSAENGISSQSQKECNEFKKQLQTLESHTTVLQEEVEELRQSRDLNFGLQENADEDIRKLRDELAAVPDTENLRGEMAAMQRELANAERRLEELEVGDVFEEAEEWEDTYEWDV